MEEPASDEDGESVFEKDLDNVSQKSLEQKDFVLALIKKAKKNSTKSGGARPVAPSIKQCKDIGMEKNRLHVEVNAEIVANEISGGDGGESPHLSVHPTQTPNLSLPTTTDSTPTPRPRPHSYPNHNILASLINEYNPSASDRNSVHEGKYRVDPTSNLPEYYKRKKKKKRVRTPKTPELILHIVEPDQPNNNISNSNTNTNYNDNHSLKDTASVRTVNNNIKPTNNNNSETKTNDKNNNHAVDSNYNNTNTKNNLENGVGVDNKELEDSDDMNYNDNDLKYSNDSDSNSQDEDDLLSSLSSPSEKLERLLNFKLEDKCLQRLASPSGPFVVFIFAPTRKIARGLAESFFSWKYPDFPVPAPPNRIVIKTDDQMPLFVFKTCDFKKFNPERLEGTSIVVIVLQDKLLIQVDKIVNYCKENFVAIGFVLSSEDNVKELQTQIHGNYSKKGLVVIHPWAIQEKFIGFSLVFLTEFIKWQQENPGKEWDVKLVKDEAYQSKERNYMLRVYEQHKETERKEREANIPKTEEKEQKEDLNKRHSIMGDWLTKLRASGASTKALNNERMKYKNNEKYSRIKIAIRGIPDEISTIEHCKKLFNDVATKSGIPIHIKSSTFFSNQELRGQVSSMPVHILVLCLSGANRSVFSPYVPFLNKASKLMNEFLPEAFIGCVIFAVSNQKHSKGLFFHKRYQESFENWKKEEHCTLEKFCQPVIFNWLHEPSTEHYNKILDLLALMWQKLILAQDGEIKKEVLYGKTSNKPLFDRFL